MTAAREKLTELRRLMKEVEVDAYYVPSTDPHNSEYVPACWQRRQWLSGFTGSAGDLLVTGTMAGLWTDGRYYLQAGRELRGSGIKLFKQGKPGVPTVAEWLGQHLRSGQVLGVDPRVLSRAAADELEAELERAGARIKYVNANLVDRIWRGRPAPSRAPIEPLPRRFAGESVAAKLRRVRKEMDRQRADAHVLTALDAIAWLFNIRSADVDYNPVAIAHAIVHRDRAQLFTNQAKVTPALQRALGRTVEILPYGQIGPALSALKRADRRVWVDGGTVNMWVLRKLSRCELVTDPSPITRMKARKNDAELEGIRAAHVRDGVAMVRFLRWLEQAVPAGEATELAASARLAELRARGEHFRGESFESIVGYGAHGAIVHYAVDESSDVPLRPKGILLVDSGGQYLDGTTDITRTVLLGGTPTREQKDRFTRVLKGHIALTTTVFPAGTAGRQIEAIARLPLWQLGLNYAHGTGHGVGAYLNVHEGPQSLSPTRCTGVPLEAGNIQSIEPGFYAEGKFGIRIENLVRVARDEKLSRGDDVFLRFEPLTLCPIDTRLVAPKMLTAAERAWLNGYHRQVRTTLEPLLEREEARWLRSATRPV